MTDFGGKVGTSILSAEFTGRVAAAYQQSGTYNQLIVDAPSALDPAGTVKSGDLELVDGKSDFARLDFAGKADDKATPAFDWFERFHIVPRELAFGNIVDTVVADLEIFSAFRRDPHDWDSFTDNVGPGVDLLGAPALAYTFPPLTSLVVQVQVTTEAPPIVDSTLEFEFDVPQTIVVPISFILVQLWNLPPEAPMEEELGWLSDVIPHTSGKATQVLALRAHPRQRFGFDVFAEDGAERARLDNLLFDWQGRPFAIPVWPEATRLTAAASISDTTITVKSTANADYRVGGLVVIYSGQAEFDVQVLGAVTSGTVLTFTTQLIRDHAAGALVAPLRIGIVQNNVRGTHYPVNAAKIAATLRVTEAGVDLADASAWPTFNGLTLVDDCNGIRGTATDEGQHQLHVFDGGTGLTFEATDWDRAKRISRKTWLAASQAALWTIRRLLHYLRGQQVRFYLPTFKEDLTPVADLSSGTATLDVVNVGYASFVRARAPRNAIQVRLVDGTTIERLILSAVEIDDDVERITVDSSWSSTVTVAEVDRISYLELVRLATDVVRIQHAPGGQFSRITTTVTTETE